MEGIGIIDGSSSIAQRNATLHFSGRRHHGPPPDRRPSRWKVEKNIESTTKVERRRAVDRDYRDDIEDCGGDFLSREDAPIGSIKRNKAKEGVLFGLNRRVVSLLYMATMALGFCFAEFSHMRRSSSFLGQRIQSEDERPERERKEARIAIDSGVKTDGSGSMEGVQQRPENWQKYGWRNIRDHFDCRRRAKDKTKAMPTEEDWKVFIDTYEKANRDYRFDDPVTPTEGYSIDGEHNRPPWRSGHSDRGGRGLFASRDLKKGELVHVGANSDSVVPDAGTYREYIFSLSEISVEKACDMLSWTWTQEDKDEVLRIFVSMNIAILMNKGRSYYYDSEVNVGPEWDDDPDSRFYAKRDIKKDEEILMDYDIYDSSWSKVGLGEIEIE